METNPTSVSLRERLTMNVLVTVLNFRLIAKEVRMSPFPVMIVTTSKQYNTVMITSSATFIFAVATGVVFVLPVPFCPSISN